MSREIKQSNMSFREHWNLYNYFGSKDTEMLISILEDSEKEVKSLRELLNDTGASSRTLGGGFYGRDFYKCFIKY